MTDDRIPSTERQQTDESLRAERDKADHPPGETHGSIEEIADAVIALARKRADDVLAAARAETDRRREAGPSRPSILRERAVEDKALLIERAQADEVLLAERAEHVALLAHEREETDKDLRSERVRADSSLATRDDFLGMVSHDLRNMLHSVVGFARLIADEAQEAAGASPSIRGYAQRIERSGSRMTRLVGDLIDVASIQAGALAVTREPADCTALVTEAAEAFQLQASASGIHLSMDLIFPCPPASLDTARILQVLANLISNAIKFTPSGGSVVVQVAPLGADLCFTVRDTGVGIAPEKLGPIFERYLQIDAKDRRGVGLGLYISKCIVLGHGGRIWAESEVSRGSTFHFTIPEQLAQATATQA